MLQMTDDNHDRRIDLAQSARIHFGTERWAVPTNGRQSAGAAHDLIRPPGRG